MMRSKETIAQQAVKIAKRMRDDKKAPRLDRLAIKILFTGRVLVPKKLEAVKIKLTESNLRDYAPELRSVGKVLLPLFYGINPKDRPLVCDILEMNKSKKKNPEQISIFKTSGKVGEINAGQVG